MGGHRDSAALGVRCYRRTLQAACQAAPIGLWGALMAADDPTHESDPRDDQPIRDSISAGDITAFAPVAIGPGAQATANVTIHQPILTPTQRLNRQRMLDKVELFWVKGVLEQSLYQIARRTWAGVCA
jgi:hypothetical protein